MINIFYLRWTLWAILLCCCHSVFSQDNSTKKIEPDEKIYKVNYWVSGGIALTGVITNGFAHDRLRGKPGMTEDHIFRIKAKGVNKFDQWGLRQDLSKKRVSEEASDRILYSSVVLPFFLFLDKEIRKSWLDIGLMYAETQAINSNLYGWGPLGPAFVERYRPAVYYDDIPLEERNFGNMRNSFYSGHVGSTATATFFAAKVYSDYHPQLGAKKYLLFGLASLPAVMVGYYRVRALKHFPSDVIVGGLVGAGLGILIPELHRLANKRASFSAIYNEQIKGMGFSYRF